MTLVFLWVGVLFLMIHFKQPKIYFGILIFISVVVFLFKEQIVNLISRFLIVVADDFKEGDKILINGVEVEVEELGLLKTSLKRGDGVKYSVGNQDLFRQKIKNLGTPGQQFNCEVRIHVPLRIPLEKIKEVGLELLPLLEHVGIVNGKAIEITQFAEKNEQRVVLMEFWIEDSTQSGAAVSEFLIQLSQLLQREGIDFKVEDRASGFDLSALKSRNFRLYAIGQVISMSGAYAQDMATGWLVYRLTHSAFWSGAALFAIEIPHLCFGTFGGVLADRVNRRKLILVTQSLLALQALVIAILSITGALGLKEVLLLNLLLGIIESIDLPARHSLMPQMVDDKRNITSANNIYDVISTFSQIAGPAIASVLIAISGESTCFIVNAFSFLAILFAIFAMRLKPVEVITEVETAAESFKAGFFYVMGNLTVRSVLIYLGLLCFLGAEYRALLPAMAASFPNSGANALAILSILDSFGGVLAWIYMGRWRKAPAFGKHIAWAGFCLGVSQIMLSRCQSLPTACVFISFCATSWCLPFMMGSIAIQTVTEDKMRGRVGGMYTAAVMGVSPFGNLLIGWLSEKLSISSALTIAGVAAWIWAFYFLRHSKEINREILAKVKVN